MDNSGLIKVADSIRLIRGQRVILDADLARLYGVETKELNKAVTRNLERFPSDFMFRLSVEEQRILRFQFGTLGWGDYSKYRARAFTEHGVAMLSGVLRSKTAVAVNIAIMRAFVRLRKVFHENRKLRRQIEGLGGKVARHQGQLGEHASQIQQAFLALRLLMEPPTEPRRKIGYLP